MNNAKKVSRGVVERPKYRHTYSGVRCTAVDTPMVSHSESIAQLEAQVMARLDGEDRIARVAMLKEQIDAGIYQPDSNALALAMQDIPFVCAMLGIGTDDILGEDANEADREADSDI
jgi:anti-sigma28 factor (negative regulator of flagellin synthesis)